MSTVIEGNGDNPGLGHIISAELFFDDTTTLQLRRRSDGWMATTITEGAGTAALGETIQHVALDGQLAIYRRYWGLPNAAGNTTEVVAWRLAGLEAMKETAT